MLVAPFGAFAIQLRSSAARRDLLPSFMTRGSSATRHRRAAVSGEPFAGLLWGLLGVAAFSFTVPFTRVAVGGLSPLLIGSGRAVVAALLAAAALAATRQRLPSRRQWARLAVVGGGVVAGFPLLTSFALTTTPASHGAVVIALLPAATATMAVLRGHERPASPHPPAQPERVAVHLVTNVEVRRPVVQLRVEGVDEEPAVPAGAIRAERTPALDVRAARQALRGAWK